MKYEPSNTNAEWRYLAAFSACAAVLGAGWFLVHPAVLFFVAATGRDLAPYVTGACMAIAASVVCFKREYRNRHTLDSLKRVAAKIWPASNLGPSFDPDRYDGDWTPSRGVAAFHDHSFLRIGDSTGAAFARQLGDRWAYAHRAPQHAQGLAVLFALNSQPGSRSEAIEFRDRLATLYTGKASEERTGQIAELLSNYLSRMHLLSIIDEATKGHAYVSTALMALLEVSRAKGGVLAAAEFLWLKGVDRPLWYALNNLGRSAHHVEGAGAVAHFEAEKRAGMRLCRPHTEAAERAVADRIRADAPASAARG